MSIIKNNFCKLSLAVLCFVFALSATAFAADAAASLEAGKKLYHEQKYDAAMDKFIDVFIEGNSQQIAEANEYVNMIHFAIGGVDVPKKVPYDAELEQQRAALRDQGKELFATPAAQEEAARQAQEKAQLQAEEARIAAQQQAALAAAPKEEIVISADELQAADPAVLSDMRREAVDGQIHQMTANVIERLNARKGVSVYMRSDMVDAIDIKADVLFDDANKFKLSAKPILDDVYALMLLSGIPSFIILPQGSYTDDVSIQAVRQAIALNSFFINQGVSSGKINFNMGLTAEQPPAKFSNLEGLSIVFDYTQQPNLKRKLSDENTPPILSLGMYPFESFIPENGEGMLIDFSVIEASSPVADWTLQIIQHNKDGKYYVVRQISGIDAVYKQIFWNGKKQYFGEILPIGRYTLLLKARDIDGREKIVRRKVTLGANEEKKAKEAATAKKSSSGKPAEAYKAKRLWTKPARIEKAGSAGVAVPAQQGVPADPYAVNTEYGDTGYNPYAPVPAMEGAPAPYGEVQPQYTAPVMPSNYDYGAPDAGYNTPYPSQMPVEEDPGAYDYGY